MDHWIVKIKVGLKYIENHFGLSSLGLTLLFSISAFIFDMLKNQFELGYSAFFGINKIIELEFDFIGLFFTIVIVLLVSVMAFYAVYPKKFDIKEDAKYKYGRMFCIQLTLTIITGAFFYLYVLSKIVLIEIEILQYVIFPLIILAGIVCFVFSFPKEKNTILEIIPTILLTAFLAWYINWMIYGVHFGDGFNMIMRYLLIFPTYFTGTAFIVAFVSGKKDKKQETDKSDYKCKKWSIQSKLFIIICSTIILISYINISVKSTGWNNAKLTTELYMTKYNKIEYILFEQTDYFIALPVKELNKYSTTTQVKMQSIENEYKYINKDEVSVRLIKLEKIEKSNKGNSIIIEFKENKE